MLVLLEKQKTTKKEEEKEKCLGLKSFFLETFLFIVSERLFFCFRFSWQFNFFFCFFVSLLCYYSKNKNVKI